MFDKFQQCKKVLGMTKPDGQSYVFIFRKDQEMETKSAIVDAYMRHENFTWEDSVYMTTAVSQMTR